jgi:O-antigen/teichoic acid export membrane protein
MSQNLARRSVTSVKWNALASVIQVVCGLVQTTVLARLLPIETFGIYAAASAVVELTTSLAAFGMGSSFLYRHDTNLDIDRSAAVHFTLKLGLTLIWTALLLGGGALFLDPQQPDLGTAFVVITICAALVHLTQTPRLILTRQVQYQRLAVLQILDSFFTAVITIGLALNGFTLWALLANNVVGVVITVLVLYIWRPFWRPRLIWYPEGMRYFLSYGASTLGVRLLTDWLDRLDDAWTGTFLGQTALGFYSRAYTFAKFPSYLLGTAIDSVSAATYAELKDERPRLSKAFFQANGLLIRTGFLMAGLLALVAPELIVLVIGERWLPMMDAFRLMLVFTLFDPMKKTIDNLFLGIGKPRVVFVARILQLAVMVIGLFTLGFSLGIAGVALIVDVMLVVGIVFLLWRSKQHVDYSISSLLLVPTAALIAGLVIANAVISLIAPESLWISGAVKAVCFCGVYAAMLFVFEREKVAQIYQLLMKYR